MGQALIRGTVDRGVHVNFEGMERGGPASTTPAIGDEEVAKGKTEGTVGYRFGIETFSIGADSRQRDTFD